MASKKADTVHEDGTIYRKKEEAGIQREKKLVVVERELDRINEATGSVSPQKVLEVARNPENPLHRYFEWDDTKAAEKYRRSQATYLIMASKYVAVLKAHEKLPALPPSASETVQVRRLIPLSRGGGHVERERALADEGARKYTIEVKLGRLRGWCREASDIEELTPIREAIERAMADWKSTAA